MQALTLMMNQRQQYRFAVERRGFLKRGEQTTLCDVVDLTEHGLQLRTELPIAVGETVRIECQLEAHTIIHCAVLVTHANHPHVGGRITEISPEDQQQLIRFMEQMITSNLGGM